MIAFVTANTIVNLFIGAIKAFRAVREFIKGRNSKVKPKVAPEEAKKIQVKEVKSIDGLFESSPQPVIRKPKIKHVKIIDADV